MSQLLVTNANTYTDSDLSAKMVREVTGYEGFLSSARFIDDDNIITGSGDWRLCTIVKHVKLRPSDMLVLT